MPPLVMGEGGRQASVFDRRSNMDLSRLFEILQALRHPETGCPWDRDQTFPDMARPLREEAEELAEAIEEGDDRHVCEEAGDLLWNVLTLLAIAEEEGRFAREACLDGIAAKMIERHPHVFGDAVAEDAEAAARLYRQAKANRNGAE